MDHSVYVQPKVRASLLFLWRPEIYMMVQKSKSVRALLLNNDAQYFKYKVIFEDQISYNYCNIFEYVYMYYAIAMWLNIGYNYINNILTNHLVR